MKDEIKQEFKEAGKTPYTIIEESSDLAIQAIKEESIWLNKYFNSKTFERKGFVGLEMQTHQSTFKVLNCDVSFTLANKEKCSVKISNPFGFKSTRFYTRLFNGRLHWINKRKILKNSELLNGFVLFKIFEKDLEGIINHFKDKDKLYLLSPTSKNNKIVEDCYIDVKEFEGQYEKFEEQYKDLFDEIVIQLFNGGS